MKNTLPYVLSFMCLLPCLLWQPSAIAQNNGQEQNADSLFQQLGGREGIDKIIEKLLPLLQSDARIKEQFAKSDMDLLSRQLSTQFCQLSGGPCRYGGDDMKLVHKNMKIDQAQFNALVEVLQLAMEAQGVATRTQNKLLAKLAPMQRDIVTK